MRLTFISLFVVIAATGCAEYATISKKAPDFHLFRTMSGAMPNLGNDLTRAGEVAKKDPPRAMGNFMAAAQAAEAHLERHPDSIEARDSYNFAVARIFTAIREAKTDPWEKPLEVPSDNGNYVLDYHHDVRKEWNPGLYDLVPVDEIEAKGLYVTDRKVKAGIGAPLVAIGRKSNSDFRANFSTDRTFYGVTAVASFRGRRCFISFADPLSSETVAVGGETYPLAADYTTPMAVMLAFSNPKKLELSRLLQPQKYADTARISRLQPYDPNKTVVLVIHGLKDSPATWAPMINALRGEEEIRKNYQFWFFSYPSGYAYPYSAAILRKELDAVEKRFPLRKPMVVIGHSMGGCISRLLLTDAGEKLWMSYFGKPPSQVALSSETKKIAQESLVFHHRPEIGRVIFVSAPLKGSDIASGWIGRISSRLVRAPFTLLDAGTEAMKAVVTSGDSLKVHGMPNSVDTLAPNNKFVREINKLPIVPGIPYHTIMGDRGKGGNHDHTPPEQSDGIVPYWSSHMDGAESERVVPSGHSAHQNPEAIKEVDRILRLHLKNQ